MGSWDLFATVGARKDSGALSKGGHVGLATVNGKTSAFRIHLALAPTQATLSPPWLFPIPIPDKTQGHLLHGTFDPWDLLAIALAGLTVYVAIQITRRAT